MPGILTGPASRPRAIILAQLAAPSFSPSAGQESKVSIGCRHTTWVNNVVKIDR